MSTRPVIFISAVSKELRSARDLVAKTLLALGYEPKWEDIAATDAGDLLGVLRKWVDDSAAVIQLVGHCYGKAPTTLAPDFGPCSYTQYEAHYARQQGKPIYYLFTDPPHPTDGCSCEPQTLHDLQEQYRQQVKAYGDLYHSSASLIQTELIIRRLKDDLAHLRAEGQKQHRSLTQKLALALVLVLGLLLVLVLGLVWLKHDQGNATQALAAIKLSQQEEGQALADLRQMLESSIKGGSEAKLTADYDAALRFIAHKRGIPLAAFRRYLEDNATQAVADHRVALKDKVRALQEAGQFVQARDFAIEQARRLETERQKSSQEEVELWTEAAKTELTLGHYDKALEYATKAVTQTDRQADFPTWSAARHQQGWALVRQRKDKESQALYDELIALQQAAFGPDNLAVLQSRRSLALSLYQQGNYVLAEQQGRPLVGDCQRVLGAEHPDTLMSRMNLANALDDQGKHAEAAQEYRAVLKLQEHVLGAEHPDTLMNRINLAIALKFQGERAEAEQEYRAALKVQERVLGAEHPAVANSCYNLALCLEAQKKLPEALAFMQRAEQVWTKALGPDHPDAKDAKADHERIEAELKAEK